MTMQFTKRGNQTEANQEKPTENATAKSKQNSAGGWGVRCESRAIAAWPGEGKNKQTNRQKTWIIITSICFYLDIMGVWTVGKKIFFFFQFHNTQ